MSDETTISLGKHRCCEAPIHEFWGRASQVFSLITTSGGLGMSGLTEIEVLERSTS